MPARTIRVNGRTYSDHYSDDYDMAMSLDDTCYTLELFHAAMCAQERGTWPWWLRLVHWVWEGRN